MNENRLSHGASSEVLISRTLPDCVKEITDAIQGEAPELLTSLDGIAVEQCARVLIRVRQLDDYIDNVHGGEMVTDAGKPLPAAQLSVSLRNSLARYLTELGMTPMSRARVIQLLSQGQKDTKLTESLEAQMELERRYGNRR